MFLINKKLLLLLFFVAASCLICTAPASVSAAVQCRDGTEVPTTRAADDGGAAFCSSHRGVENGKAHCWDGTEISQSVEHQGTQEEFCKTHGGVDDGSMRCNDGTVVPRSYKQASKEAEFCGQNNRGGIASTATTSGTDGQTEQTAEDKQIAQDEFKCKSTAECINDNPIIEWMNRIIRFLAIIVGIVVTIMIVVGGIQYSTAGGDPGKVAGAKKTITSALLALLTYLFLRAILAWIVPGGAL